jgi:hypothetical protein
MLKGVLHETQRFTFLNPVGQTGDHHLHHGPDGTGQYTAATVVLLE